VSFCPGCQLASPNFLASRLFCNFDFNSEEEDPSLHNRIDILCLQAKGDKRRASERVKNLRIMNDDTQRQPRWWSLAGMLGLFFFIFTQSASAFGNGVNLQPSYYNNGNVTFGWELMKSYSQIKTVRIEIEPDKISQGKEWISQAKKQGYAVIATYHKCAVLGSDDPKELQAAANWWVQNYGFLSGGGSFTVNLMNEWGSHNQSPDSYSSAYNSAISTLRQVYSGDVIIDVPGWGQETSIASKASSLLQDNKLIFSAHIYPAAWNQAKNNWVQPSDMDELKSTGRPCMIGEYGTRGDGSCDVVQVINRAKSIGFSGVLAWAWNGDGGDMNMLTPAWSNNPTASTYTETSYFWEVLSLL
jgi:mannan endo-1,4-beta-mannosidase